MYTLTYIYCQMVLFSPADRALAELLFALNETNPFTPKRVELERKLLGSQRAGIGTARSRNHENPEVALRLSGGLTLAEALLHRSRRRLAELGRSRAVDPRELELYENTAVFTLYHRWFDRLMELVHTAEFPRDPRQSSRGEVTSHDPLHVPWYEPFREEAREALRPGGRRLALDLSPPHLLALFFQIARAFHQIYANILGTSTAAVNLRAAIWQSVFTHDIRRYQRSVYRRMHDLSTLVTGPSGTGKELVAQAIGLSSYLPFNERKRSFDPNAEAFQPLNLSTLAPALIESELFGHKRGAFTGALEDRRGWFEICPWHGTVFLDEIGEISAHIQLKLLRVLQTRRFQRVGETRPRSFRGKLVSATNRDLEQSMARGEFREDFYYRICSDHIVTPSLAEQIDGSMEELRGLALHVASSLVREESADLADEAVTWVASHLGRDYDWPGNFRELEQCVRSVLVRREYHPCSKSAKQTGRDVRSTLSRSFERGDRSAEEILRDYCTLVYAEQGSFGAAARVLGIDRRTVKAKLDSKLLGRLRGS